MAFRRRFRRRRFGGRRAVARKEPVWITTAYNVTAAPNVEQHALFQLIGPEDYTPDYVSEPQRKDRCTLVRTVGSFLLQPNIPEPADGVIIVAWKAALFVAGDKQVDDAFANDPGQFSLTSPTVFPPFCRDYAPMHVFWNEYFVVRRALTAVTASTLVWYPPPSGGRKEWDINVKRKLEGDDALFLLVNAFFTQNPTQEFGGAIDVESRNLIMDQ